MLEGNTLLCSKEKGVRSPRLPARAVAAAELQGKAPEMRTRLHRTRLVPDPEFLRALAEGMALDPDRLLADMASAPVTARIAQTLGLANGFGIPGTPALVVGDLLAIGRDAVDLTLGIAPLPLAFPRDPAALAETAQHGVDGRARETERPS